jgi:hypothetical protein
MREAGIGPAFMSGATGVMSTPPLLRPEWALSHSLGLVVRYKQSHVGWDLLLDAADD